MIRKKINTDGDLDEGGRPAFTVGNRDASAAKNTGNETVGLPAASNDGPTAEQRNAGNLRDTNSLAEELIAVLGASNIASVMEGLSHLNILPGNKYLEPQLWLANIFDSYFTNEQVANLCQHYSSEKAASAKREEAARQTISSLNTDVAALQTKLGALEAKNNVLDETISNLHTKLKSFISANTVKQLLVQQFPEAFSSVKKLLFEDTDEDESVKIEFIAKLILPLAELERLLQQKPTDGEEQYMQDIGIALRGLLLAVSGLHIIQRREILDVIGEACSNEMVDYVFVSPESTLVVDPSIHNAKAVSGTTVKEGLSYAVIRKNSRQTIKLADIKVI